MEQPRVQQLIRIVLDGAGDFEGKEELLAQIDYVTATGSPTWLKLEVDDGPPVSPARTNPIPGTCWAYDPAGKPIGALVLWTTDGWLSDLELGWVTEEPPSDLPDPSLVRH
jgi:hypothetical protein